MRLILPSRFVIDLETFDLSSLTIRDLAHNLSWQSRFAGKGITVAEHSIFVARWVKKLLADAPGYWTSKGADFDSTADAIRWGLLHDAVEGLGLLDLPSPVKQLDQLEGYCRLERAGLVAIADRFGLGRVIPAVVKQADDEVGKAEQLQVGLVPPFLDKWSAVRPIKLSLPHWPRVEAEERFLKEAEKVGLAK